VDVEADGSSGLLGGFLGFVGLHDGYFSDSWAGCLAWNMALSMPDWVI
jgi:hypothetical protein